MASSTTTSKPAKRTTRAKGGSKAKTKGQGSASKAKPASKRPTYSDEVRAITEKARGLACPETRQGPVAKQVSQIMADLKDPRQALKDAGLTQAQVRAIAQGDGDAEAKKKLRTLAERVDGAPQWTRGRPLAATITAWLEAK
jgi:hypothetical protein